MAGTMSFGHLDIFKCLSGHFASLYRRNIFYRPRKSRLADFKATITYTRGSIFSSSEGFITSFLSASGFKRTIIIEVTAAALQKGKMKRITRNHTGMAVRRQESISYAVSSKTDFCCVTTRDSTCMMFAVYVSQVS